MLAALALVALAGCESTVPHTDYFPLRDGNRWVYRLLDRPLLKRLNEGQAIVTGEADPLGKTPQAEFESPLKAEVVDDLGKSASEAERPAFARSVSLELRAAIDPLTYRALYDTAEQVWSKRDGYVGFQSVRGRSYLLILPPHTGYKWVVTTSGGQNLYCQIESAQAAIGTPKQQFQNCAVVRQESRDRNEIFRYWFAPNVGLVRRSKYFMQEEVFRQELVDFSVKPATPATRMAEQQEVRKATEGTRRGTEFREAGHENPHDLGGKLEDGSLNPNPKSESDVKPR